MLIAVQAMELAWVVLNYLGIERTTTAPVVRSVADIHLAYMPYSHSLATALGAALIAWLVLETGLGRPFLGRAVGLGIVSHLILDLLTHAHDIVLWPGRPPPLWASDCMTPRHSWPSCSSWCMESAAGGSIEEDGGCWRSS